MTTSQPITITLQKKFGESLRLALTGGGDRQSFGVPSNEIINHVDVKYLDDYSTAQWEGILHYVVNSVEDRNRIAGQGPTPAVKKLLEVGNMVTTGRHAGGGITQAGFSFLLQEVNAQVWTLLFLWIENAQEVVSNFSQEWTLELTWSDANGPGRSSLFLLHARVARSRSPI